MKWNTLKKSSNLTEAQSKIYIIVSTKCLYYNRFISINPIQIRMGDIIEAQVSFVVVPLKGRKYKMLIVLRAIAIIDSSLVKVSTCCLFSANSHSYSYQNAALVKAQQHLKRSFSGPTLKRKVGYMLNSDEDIEEEETTNKVGKMSIDED